MLADWTVVMTSYCFVVIQVMGDTMTSAETCTAPLCAATMALVVKLQSNQLYCMLLLLCRQQPLFEMMNSSEGECMVAWRRLVNGMSCELAMKSRAAGTVCCACCTGTSRKTSQQGGLFGRDVFQRSGGILSAIMKVSSLPPASRPFPITTTDTCLSPLPPLPPPFPPPSLPPHLPSPPPPPIPIPPHPRLQYDGSKWQGRQGQVQREREERP